MAGSMAAATAVVQGAQAPAGAQVQQRRAIDSDTTGTTEATGPFVADVAIDSDLLDTRGRRLQPTHRLRYRLSTTEGPDGPSVSVQFTAPPSEPGRGGPIAGLPGFRLLIDPKGVQVFDPQGKPMPTPSALDEFRTLAVGARQLVLSRTSTARRARLTEAHGRLSGRIRKLDRYIQVNGTRVIETLVDPTLAVPVELTLTDAGRRLSATRITYGTLPGNRLYRAREVGEADRTVNPQAPMHSVVTTVHTPVDGGAQ
jgi:hypothetical protein